MEKYKICGIELPGISNQYAIDTLATIDQLIAREKWEEVERLNSSWLSTLNREISYLPANQQEIIYREQARNFLHRCAQLK